MVRVHYFVLSPSGQKYGPADMATLQQWIAEGRLLPTSHLESADGMSRYMASQLPGLRFDNPGYPQGGVIQTPYSPPISPGFGGNPTGFRFGMGASPMVGGSKDATYAMWLATAVILLCACIPAVGFFMSVAALVLAYRAQRSGDYRARNAIALSWFALLLSLASQFFFSRIMSMLGSLNQ